MDKLTRHPKDMGRDFAQKKLALLMPEGWELERLGGHGDREYYRATGGDNDEVVSSPQFQNVLMRTKLLDEIGEDVFWEGNVSPQRWAKR